MLDSSGLLLPSREKENLDDICKKKQETFAEF